MNAKKRFQKVIYKLIYTSNLTQKHSAVVYYSILGILKQILCYTTTIISTTAKIPVSSVRNHEYCNSVNISHISLQNGNKYDDIISFMINQRMCIKDLPTKPLFQLATRWRNNKFYLDGANKRTTITNDYYTNNQLH